jgi:hypothetical protein
MNRREFLGVLAAGVANGLPSLGAGSTKKWPSPNERAQPAELKSYGSGYFGNWITDQFGLPAYRYTCDQIADPKAVSPVHPEWRSPTDHTHQVGNDRLVAVVSNYGYVQVRQDEGSPKFLNDFAPEQGRYGGGFGFLSDGNSTLSTYYPGQGESFDRIFGEGYLQKIVRGHGYEVDHVIFAPFGDDPVLLSRVEISNHGSRAARLRWIEYWGCQNYQFSYRSYMEASVAGKAADAARLRRQFAARFAHQFRVISDHRGLLESQKFLGRAGEEQQAWEKVEAQQINNPSGFFGGRQQLSPGTSMEDLDPPPTFLVSLDAPMDAFGINATTFFGRGGVQHPSGLSASLNNDLAATGSESAFLIERRLDLEPGQSQSLHFLYGYVPAGFHLDALVKKYQADVSWLWSRSCAAWKTDGLRFRSPGEPWVERETSWHHYYLRSNLTHDSFFQEPILSQGHVYQYIIGFQGAARDPLQHAFPFIFSNPEIVQGIIRYTLKEIQADGSIPYGIVGCGVPMPVIFHPSDQQMWLLWLASEYVLATRDKDFLARKIPVYPRQQVNAGDPTIRDLLTRCYVHVSDNLGVGDHGLMRLSNGDWNDDIVVGHVPPALAAEVRQHGESVLNAAMAAYVLDYYGTLLDYIGDAAAAQDAQAKADGQRRAVWEQWTGSWFRRAWLGPQLGWIGEDHLWLEPQPWAIIGGAATPEQSARLLERMNDLLRKPSPIGAMLQSQGDDTMASPAGILTNGGIWPSINGTLIWALALVNGTMAWDEWKKNSLVAHAEAYPQVWYGIWSGPDSYNSVLSRYPGQTMFAEPPSPDHKVQADLGCNWTDFPVMNMHPHAWPLYSAAKLLGLEFHGKGLAFKPQLPLSEYEFTSTLLGFKKSGNGYSGWYAPATAGSWEITLRLPAAEVSRIQGVKIDGVPAGLRKEAGSIRFSGGSQPGAPLRWEIS